MLSHKAIRLHNKGLIFVDFIVVELRFPRLIVILEGGVEIRVADGFLEPGNDKTTETLTRRTAL